MQSTKNEAAAATGAATTPQSLFELEQLPVPPLPQQMVAQLRRAGPTVLSTRPQPEAPYDFFRYLTEFESDLDRPAYAVVGFDGHGTNSWAAHYYVVNDGLALFIQLPWGGIYLDPEPARAEMGVLFEWAAQLQAKIALAQQQALIPRSRRLEVAASRFYHAGWRWLEVGADHTAVPWQSAAGMTATVLQELDDILTRKRSL